MVPFADGLYVLALLILYVRILFMRNRKYMYRGVCMFSRSHAMDVCNVLTKTLKKYTSAVRLIIIDLETHTSSIYLQSCVRCFDRGWVLHLHVCTVYSAISRCVVCGIYQISSYMCPYFYFWVLHHHHRVLPPTQTSFSSASSYLMGSEVPVRNKESRDLLVMVFVSFWDTGSTGGRRRHVMLKIFPRVRCKWLR